MFNKAFLVAVSSLMTWTSLAFGKPLIDGKEIYTSADGRQHWEVLKDDENPRLFYRLPDSYQIAAENGRHLVESRWRSDGAMLFSFTWGARDTMHEQAELRGLIAGAHGVSPIFATILPSLVRFELDPDIASTFRAKVDQDGPGPVLTPGSFYRTRIIVPSDTSEAFTRRLTSFGLIGSVAMTVSTEDTPLGTDESAFPYTVAWLIGGLERCEVWPETPCF